MLWRRRRTTEDFNEEIRAHIELETDRLIGCGMAAEEARAVALRNFGNVTAAQERFYESRRILWLDHLLQDFRFALRSIARYPLACGIAAISLAGGIGSATATLVLRDALFLKPPPLYRDPQQLSVVGVSTPQRGRELVPGALYEIWNEMPGAGRPLSKGTGSPLEDPLDPLHFPHNFNRISTPDANSCAACHNIPFAGGAGDIVANVFVLVQRFHFATFDSTDVIVTKGTLAEDGHLLGRRVMLPATFLASHGCLRFSPVANSNR